MENDRVEITPTAADMGAAMASVLAGNSSQMTAGRKVCALLGMAAIFAQSVKKFGLSRGDAMKLVDAALDANEVA